MVLSCDKHDRSDNMEITEVRIHKANGDGSKLKAYATVTIDDCFLISNIRIIQGENRLFCAMPSRRLADGRFDDIVHPMNQETRDLFESKILDKYKKEIVE